MKPYFETELGKLYHGDCLEIMPKLDSATVAITDPPYNVGLSYDNIDDNKENYSAWIALWFPLLPEKKAISCGVGNLNLWGSYNPYWILAWRKPNSCKRVGVGWNTWEPILVWGKPIKKTIDSFTVSIVPQRDTGEHPCPKPKGWASEIVDRYVDIKDVTLDPFVGSGTTAVVCEHLHRKWIGIEISEKYCEIAAKRIEAEASQLKLFN